MKSIFLICCFIAPFMLLGQTTGSISYTETLKLDVELPEGMEQFKDMIPSSTEFQKTLLFNKEETLYKNAPTKKANDHSVHQSEEGGAVQFQMDFANADNQMYTDLKSGKTLEKNEFMGKTFLVKGISTRYKWKMTGEQKTILDYTCQQAIFKDEDKTIIAWFTSQIPVSAGPMAYAGLPGMILEVDVDAGKQSILATSIELKELENNAIAAPKKGKKVTQEEYDKIVDEKTKEMQEEFGGSGNMIIKTIGN